MNRIRIGSRGSDLALWQARWVRDRLTETFPNLEVTIEIIKTTGDKILDAPLARIGDKGLFTREIEERLLAETIDLAVHSLKDLPTSLPGGLCLGAVTEREDVRDVFLPRPGNPVHALLLLRLAGGGFSEDLRDQGGNPLRIRVARSGAAARERPVRTDGGEVP